MASSALRAVSGSGTDRSHGLRPDAPVPPRAPLSGPRGHPTHFGCLTPVWDSLEPALRARIGSISLRDAEASFALARAAADVDDPGSCLRLPSTGGPPPCLLARPLAFHKCHGALFPRTPEPYHSFFHWRTFWGWETLQELLPSVCVECAREP